MRWFQSKKGCLFISVILAFTFISAASAFYLIAVNPSLLWRQGVMRDVLITHVEHELSGFIGKDFGLAVQKYGKPDIVIGPFAYVMVDASESTLVYQGEPVLIVAPVKGNDLGVWIGLDDTADEKAVADRTAFIRSLRGKSLTEIARSNPGDYTLYRHLVCYRFNEADVLVLVEHEGKLATWAEMPEADLPPFCKIDMSGF